MNAYLLDTNICIYHIKGRYNLVEKVKAVGAANCFISEITLAELQFGVENSLHKAQNQEALDNFLMELQVVPIYQTIGLYAKEKARLRRLGKVIDDFDLLIGTTAVTHDFVMVTNNTEHFERIDGIVLEDWTLAVS